VALGDLSMALVRSWWPQGGPGGSKVVPVAPGTHSVDLRWLWVTSAWP